MIRVVPKGEHRHGKSGLIQVVDDVAIKAMAAAFDPKKKLLYDFDHYSDLTASQLETLRQNKIKLPSDAAGWGDVVEAREDGLWANLDPTSSGSDAIKNKLYMYLSPTFPKKHLEVIGDMRVRPLVLGKVAFTNEPQIEDIDLSSLANSAENESVLGPLVENSANDEDNENSSLKGKIMDYKAKLLSLLKLSADATDSQIETALAAATESQANLTNENATLKTDNASLKNRAETAEGKVADAERATIKIKVEAALKEHEGVIQNRADVEAALTKDFDGTLKVLKGLKSLPNREDGGLPAFDKDSTLTGLDRVKKAFSNK